MERIELDGKLTENLANLPEKSGCYLFYDKNDVLLYVGKAINLKKRINSHLIGKKKFISHPALALTQTVQFIRTHNEKEALLLEQKLISELKPRLNFRGIYGSFLYYLCIQKISRSHDLSYTLRTDRNISFGKIIRKYGPFPEGFRIRKLLELLEWNYPLAKCKRGNLFLEEPCIYSFLHRCSGWCYKNVSVNYYKEQVKGLDSFFSGKTEKVKKKAKERLNQEIEKSEFEKAQQTKKLIDTLDEFTVEQSTYPSSSGNHDYFSCKRSPKEEKAIAVLVSYRLNNISLIKRWLIWILDKKDISSRCLAILLEMYGNRRISLPTAVISDVNFSFIEKNLIEDQYQVNVREARTMQERTCLEFVQLNCEIVDGEVEKVEKWNYGVTGQLAFLIGLKKIERIDILDISNIAGENSVGAVLSVVGERKCDRCTRCYKFDNSAGGDVGLLVKLIRLRYGNRNKKKNLNVPELIIVDGSKAHIRSAQRELEDLGMHKQLVLGMVKNERHQSERLIRADGSIIISSQKIREEEREVWNFLCYYHELVDRIAKNCHSYQRKKSLSEEKEKSS